MDGALASAFGKGLADDFSIPAALLGGFARSGSISKIELDGYTILILRRGESPAIDESVSSLREIFGAAGSGAPVLDDPRPVTREDRVLFRQEGEYWTVGYPARPLRLKDSKGLQHIAHLLRNPGTEFHVLQLAGCEAPETRCAATIGGDPGYAVRSSSQEDVGPALDGRAKAEYRRRVEELREELADAECTNDLGRLEKLHDEIAAITRELAGAVGLGGRDRRMSDAAERARVNVTRTIRASIAAVRKRDPAVGRYLAATITTGTFCRYAPDADSRLRWEL